MLRYCRQCLQKSPFEVLGVPMGASEAEVKRRYHELARQHHPDMPSGNPEKFKEIHAAFALIKSGAAAGMRSAAAASARARDESGGATAQRFYGRKGGRTRAQAGVTDEEAAQMKDEMAARKGVMVELWSSTHPSVKALALLGVGVGVLYWQFRRQEAYYLERRVQFAGDIAGSDYGGGAMPAEVETATFRDRVSLEDRLAEAKGQREQRAANLLAMRRYDDLREFFFVNDPDSCLERKYATQRVMTSLLDVAAIPEKCPIVIELHAKPNDLVAYDRQVTRAVQQALTADGVRFTSVDAEEVALSGAVALSRIPKLSPAVNEWSFIQYRENGVRGAPARCLVAVHNAGIGGKKAAATSGAASADNFSQLITISGSDALQPALALERARQIASGALDPKKLVPGGIVPVTKAESAPAKPFN